MLEYEIVPPETTEKLCETPVIVPRAMLLGATAAGSITVKFCSVTVDVFEKDVKPPPGWISGVKLNAEDTVVMFGKTDLTWLVVAPPPPVIRAFPELNIDAEPATDPATLNDETVIVPEAAAEVESVTPAWFARGCAVVTRIEPPGAPLPEAVKAPVAMLPTDERIIDPPVPAELVETLTPEARLIVPVE